VYNVKIAYLLVFEVSLHATLFAQVESAVAVRVVLGKHSLDLRIGVATPDSDTIAKYTVAPKRQTRGCAESNWAVKATKAN